MKDSARLEQAGVIRCYPLPSWEVWDSWLSLTLRALGWGVLPRGGWGFVQGGRWGSLLRVNFAGEGQGPESLILGTGLACFVGCLCCPVFGMSVNWRAAGQGAGSPRGVCEAVGH